MSAVHAERSLVRAKAKKRAGIETRNRPGKVTGTSYSSSIWLYITRTVRQAFDSAFRIGVLHLVARRATSERLDDASEKALKRVLSWRNRVGFADLGVCVQVGRHDPLMGNVAHDQSAVELA